MSSLSKKLHLSMWPYISWLFILGVLLGLKQPGGAVTAATLAYFLWFSIGGNLYGMLLNDHFDRELDLKNPRKTHPAISPFWCVVGIGASLLSFALLAIIYPNGHVLLYAAIAIIGNALYSIPPIRLKKLPIVDAFVGPMSYLTALGAGYVLTANAAPAWWATLAGVLFFYGNDLFFKVFDVQADYDGGLRATTALLGAKGSLTVSAAVLFVSAMLLFQAEPQLGLGVVPYLALLFVCFNKKDSALATIERKLPLLYTIAGFIATTIFLT